MIKSWQLQILGGKRDCGNSPRQWLLPHYTKASLHRHVSLPRHQWNSWYRFNHEEKEIITRKREWGNPTGDRP